MQLKLSLMQNPKIIVIAGPTASGKTSLGIELALKFNGEIISADSRQIFRGLDVGSGKVKESEKRGIPHHLIDILDPEQKYNVYKFQKDCLNLIQEISARGKLPIIVGGTGLYIESVVEQYTFTPPPGGGARRAEGAIPLSISQASKLRSHHIILPHNKELIQLAKQNRKNLTKYEAIIWSAINKNQLGVKFTKQKVIGNYIVDFYCPELSLVLEIDGGYHNYISEEDQIRQNYLESLNLKVIRIQNEDITDQIKTYLQDLITKLKSSKSPLRPSGTSPRGGVVGGKFEETQPSDKSGPSQGRDGVQVKKLGLRPNTLILNLNPERDIIKLNIQKRLISRWNDEGMLQEVQNLINSGVSKTWLKSLGLEYKFITQYLDGEFKSEQELLTKLNTESWHFAKRQITFLKRWNYAHQIQTPEQALSLAKEFLV